jgi:hypothetical protein
MFCRLLVHLFGHKYVGSTSARTNTNCPDLVTTMTRNQPQKLSLSRSLPRPLTHTSEVWPDVPSNIIADCLKSATVRQPWSVIVKLGLSRHLYAALAVVFVYLMLAAMGPLRENPKLMNNRVSRQARSLARRP